MKRLLIEGFQGFADIITERAGTLSIIIVVFGLLLGAWCIEARAAYEEVEVMHVSNTEVLKCPVLKPGEGNNASQSAWLWNYPEMPPEQGLGTVLGMAVGGGIAYYATGKTMPTVVGSIVGGWAGYKLFEPSHIKPADRVSCTKILGYRVQYKRRNGYTGELVLNSWPVGKFILVNFCPGTYPGALERPC